MTDPEREWDEEVDNGVSPERQDSIEDQWRTVQQQARRAARSQRSQKSIERLNQAASRLDDKIRLQQMKGIILNEVLILALTKDLIDLIGIGYLDFVDWTLDLSLGLAFFLFRIEKNPKDNLLGWGVVVLEIIFGVIPAWTGRVLIAMKKSRDKISQQKKTLSQIQVKLATLSNR